MYTKDDFKSHYFLFRFDTNERLDNFRKNGYMYLKNLKFFIDLESKTNEKGKGDFNEGRACLVENVKIYDQNNNLLGFTTLPSTLRKTDIKQPIYCMTAKNVSEHITEINSSSFNIRIEFDKKMIDDFCKNNADPHVLMIHDTQEFLRRVKSTLNEMDLGYKTGLVEYRDTSVSHEINGDVEFNGPFHKEECFSYQDEFRILVKTPVEDHLDFSIGNIEDISIVFPISLDSPGIEIADIQILQK